MSAIKGQVLFDFITKLSDVSRGSLPDHLWILETNESSKTVGGGAGMVLLSPEGLLVAEAVKFSF